MQKYILLFLLMALPMLGYGQLDCNRTEPSNFTWYGPQGYWVGHTFQISPDYKPDWDGPREFKFGDGNRQYKGYVKHGAGGLPTNTLNFDLNLGGSYAEDGTFFKTDSVRNSNDNRGCDVERQYFGLVLRSNYTIPAGQSGIYIYTIGSDDGSSLRVEKMLGGSAQSEERVHDNWSGGKTYDYEDNIINSYREYEEGQALRFNLSYYEIEGPNRLSFRFERYFGPGEIEGNQEVTQIAPNPARFKSKAPAVFKEGEGNSITYQWQVSRDLTPDNWEDIAGATELEYDVPAYLETQKASAEGLWHYRRIATLTNEDTTFAIPTNELTVKLNFVENLDREEFGENSWIGHIYKGLGDFDDPTFQYNAYMGRFYEDLEFRQVFHTPPDLNSTLLDYRFPITDDYDLVTTDFSVRYKMRLDVVPGVYRFRVDGDDGFNLYINGALRIHVWEDGPPKRTSVEYTVHEKGTLELVLDYYEKTGNNLIEFDIPSFILPLEWGRVNAEACGQNNCLTWETIQEKNTSHFELERSYDGIHWVMFDNAVQAQGMSTEKVTYNFADSQFLSSLVYYRIKQLDLDGSFAYSDVMRVVNNSFASRLRPYPNPTFEKIRFFSPGEVFQLTLFNNTIITARGLMFERVHKDIYEADLTGIKNGNYFLKVQHIDGGTEVFKIIKK